MAGLSKKQARFVEEYLIDLNATAAAGRAGYKDPNIGRQLITKNNVSEAIQEALQQRSRRTEITQDRVLQEFARIAFFDPANLFDELGKPLPISQIDEDTRRAISGLDVCTIGSNDIGPGEIQKFKIANKLGALEQIGKHLGMFQGKQDDDDDKPNPTKVEIIVKDARKQPAS